MTTAYEAPGVYTTESLLPAPTSTPPASLTSVAGFIGEWWRGPSGFNGAQLITSWEQFVQIYGGFNPSTVPVLANPYLGYAVSQFFANGGAACYVARITSSTTPGSTATVTLKDSSATPQNTLSLTAGAVTQPANVGTWGNQLYVSVANRGGANSGRFDLTIYYGGSSLTNVVEQWIDLSMNPADPRYVLTILNSAAAGSQYVTATNLGDGATAPANTPAVVAVPTAFTGGVDSADPSSTDWENAVTFNNGTAPLDQVPGMLSINLPGQVTPAIIDAAIVYAASRPQSFLVADTASGLTSAGAVSYVQSLAPAQSEYVAVYYPWLNTVNPASASLQATILLPPGGAVLGQYATNDLANGVWKAPGGVGTAFANVVSAERRLSPMDLDVLNSNNVNALKTRSNKQVEIWGVRTLETGYSTRYVNIRRTLNYLEAQFTSLLEPFVFSANDSVTWSIIANQASQILSNLWTQGAFAGGSSSTAYYVTCNSTNNTPQTVAQGIINLTIGVALIYPAEFIALNLVQFQNSGLVAASIS